MDENAFVQSLVGQPLINSIKSPDTNLYQFGFGKFVELRPGRRVSTTALHVLCRFKVIWKNGERRVERFYEDSECEYFYSIIERLYGLVVKRVALSDENDLWIDFGEYWLVFATHKCDDESWRLFMPHTEDPHLVASANKLSYPSQTPPIVRGQGEGLREP